MKRKRNRGTARRGLPQHLILSNILPRLPVKSLLRFKSVCKDWQSLISNDHDFAKLQLQFQRACNNYDDRYCLVHEYGTHRYKSCTCSGTRLFSLKLNMLSPKRNNIPEIASELAVGQKPIMRKSPRHVQVLGSSNGLICLSHKMCRLKTPNSQIIRRYELWNPATGGRWLIPAPPQLVDHYYSLEPYCRVLSEGFVYIPSVDDYKIVILRLHPISTPKIYHAMIFSFTTNIWEQIEQEDNCKDDLPNSYFRGGNVGGFQVGESLYWKIDYNPISHPVVLAFNLVNNLIHWLKVPLPDPAPEPGWLLCGFYTISKVRERLCVSWPNKNPYTLSYKVNVIFMLDDDGVNWKKVFPFEDIPWRGNHIQTLLVQLNTPDLVEFFCISGEDYVQTLISPYTSHRPPTTILPIVDFQGKESNVHPEQV